MFFLKHLPRLPLNYPDITNSNQITNVLLIDNSVKDYQTIVDSVNPFTFFLGN